MDEKDDIVDILLRIVGVIVGVGLIGFMFLDPLDLYQSRLGIGGPDRLKIASATFGMIVFIIVIAALLQGFSRISKGEDDKS